MNIEDIRDEFNDMMTGEQPNEKNEVRKMAKMLQKKCEDLNIPMIFVMCTKKDGYQIRCLLPDEFENGGELGNHPDRFLELLRVAKGFDKEKYKNLLMRKNNLI